MRFPIIALIAVLILSSGSVFADRKGQIHSVHKVSNELENLQRFKDYNDVYDNYHLGTSVAPTKDDYKE